MEQPDLSSRVSALEEELRALKTSQKTDVKRGGRLRTCVRFLIGNWVLLSFLSALLTAAYVKYEYHVDYFESYRNIYETKKLSGFYEQMGDRMMAKTEWQAAEQAYRAALQLDANNTAATFGIVKAQVFQPLPGQKYFAPEVVDAKLDYLSFLFPDDYQIYFLKALRYDGMGDFKQEKSWLDKCIAKNSEFAGCYQELGSIYLRQSQISDAEVNFAKAVKNDPNSGSAKNNLAVCRILSSDFPGAIRLFEESLRGSGLVVTAVSLGEAYWYNAQFNYALQTHLQAAEYMEKVTDTQDRFIGGAWTSSYLPLRAGDLETVKTHIQVNSLEQMKALAHYDLAIDEALLDDDEAADREFANALKLERSREYRELAQNRLQSVENLVPMSMKAKTWMEEHRKMLE